MIRKKICFKDFYFNVHWLSRGKTLAWLCGSVIRFLIRNLLKNEYSLSLAYLADIFSAKYHQLVTTRLCCNYSRCKWKSAAIWHSFLRTSTGRYQKDNDANFSYLKKLLHPTVEHYGSCHAIGFEARKFIHQETLKMAFDGYFNFLNLKAWSFMDLESFYCGSK